MNENLNLVEILKDCPKGTKLYSLIYGDVTLELVKTQEGYLISYRTKSDEIFWVTSNGRLDARYNGECVLFPSKEQRDWSKFKPKKPKFDPKTLQPFDKVLVRNYDSDNWKVQLFSYIIEGKRRYPYFCINNPYTCCIPYNDDTKHLAGTKDKAPEFYRYWEK